MNQAKKDPNEESSRARAATDQRPSREVKTLDEPPPDQGGTKGGLPALGD